MFRTHTKIVFLLLSFNRLDVVQLFLFWTLFFSSFFIFSNVLDKKKKKHKCLCFILLWFNGCKGAVGAYPYSSSQHIHTASLWSRYLGLSSNGNPKFWYRLLRSKIMLWKNLKSEPFSNFQDSFETAWKNPMIYWQHH